MSEPAAEPEVPGALDEVTPEAVEAAEADPADVVEQQVEVPIDEDDYR